MSPGQSLAATSASAVCGLHAESFGWSLEARRKNRHLLAYNSRFLIPPWIQVPHLASHVLGRMARRLPVDWQRINEVNAICGACFANSAIRCCLVNTQPEFGVSVMFPSNGKTT